MDWRELLGDLETQMLAEERLELEAEVADRAVREAATLGLADRLRAAVDTVARLEVRGAGSVGGLLVAVGVDWLMLRESAATATSLVPLDALVGVRDLAGGARSLDGVVAARYTVQMVLRRISLAGQPVVVMLDEGSARRGRLGIVGKDYVELIGSDAERTLMASSALAIVRPA